MSTSDPNDLQRRIEQLEAENARLKAQELAVSSNQLIVTEGEYQGHPVLTFRRGNSRPFNLGLRKLESIKEAMPTIDKFLAKHGRATSDGTPTMDDNQI